MGQKSSKQHPPWPPYAYQPGMYGAQPVIPPNFPMPQHYPPFQQPGYLPHAGMYGQGAALPPPQLAWMPQDKQAHEAKKKTWRRKARSQSEHYPGGYAPGPMFPQPVVPPPPPPPNNAPVIPKSPKRKSTRRRRPQPPEPVIPARQPTPFIPAGMNDSDETSESESEEEDDDDDEFPRRRHQGSSRRARSEEYHPVTGQFEDVIQPPSPAPQAAFGPSGPRPAGSLRNPLPKPPRDLYEMTPYKSLLSLPQTTALLTASYNTQASTATATVAPAGVTIVPPVPNQAAPAAATAPPPPPAKKKGLFKRLSTKRKTQQPPAPVPAAPAVPSGPVFVPIYVDKNANPTAQQSQASSSNTQSNPPTNPVRFDDSVDSSTAANQSRRQSRVSSNAPDPSTLPLRFTQLDSEYAGFMNHSPHRVVYGHQTYPTATHVHEAMKYIDQHPQLAERIRNCENVLDVYPISAEISGFQRPDWGNVFLDKMEEVLRLKFSQHPNLRELLMGTWPRELIYADPLDDFWGEGPEARGRNELGKVLMRVRDRMKAETMIPQ